MNYSPSLSLEVKQISLASSLYDGIEDNDISQIKHLLEVKHASPNFVIPDKGMSAMHLIAGSKPESFVLDVTRLFLLHDGDPNIRSNDGMTPVHVASAWGQSSLLQLLLNSGGDPELCDDEGLTPLDYAERENHTSVVEMLSQFIVTHDTPQDDHNITLELERLLLEEEDFGAEFVLDAEEEKIPHSSNQLELHREMLASLDDRDENISWQRVLRWCEQQNEQSATQNHVASLQSNPLQSSNNPLLSLHSPTQYHTASLQSNTNPSFHTPDLSSKILNTHNSSQKSNHNSPLSKNVDNSSTMRLPVNCSPSSDSDYELSIRYTPNSVVTTRYMDNEHPLNSEERERTPTALHKFVCRNIQQTYDVQALNPSTPKVSASDTYIPKTIQSEAINTVQKPQNITDCVLQENVTIPKTLLSHYSNDNLHTIQEKQTGYSLEEKKDCETAKSKKDPKSIEQNITPKTLFGYKLEENNLSALTTNPSGYKIEENNGEEAIMPIINIINATLEENNTSHLQKTGRVKESTTSQNITTSHLHPRYTPQPGQLQKIKYATYTTQSSGSDSDAFFTCESHKQTMSSRSAVSAVYKYTDRDHNIVLIEKRMPTSSCASMTEVSESEIETHSRLCSNHGSVSTIPSDLGYCTEALRRELQSRGYPTGPITSSTKRVYLRKLSRLRKGQPVDPPSPGRTRYSRELERTTRDIKLLDTNTGSALEQRMSQQFANPAPGRRWREGVTKCSFTYLLLDPRVTCNLPMRASSLSLTQCWTTFLHSVFYVGKGKRARPYSHLYQAVDVWKQKNTKSDKKTNHILDIWSAGHGVVCLHVFQSIIPVEAYTREAAMIDALGLENVCNLKKGEYYGEMACKSPEQRRVLGVYLLFRAMHVLLHEGERQLQPLDIM